MMSGGHFDWAYSIVQRFASDLIYQTDHAGEIMNTYGHTYPIWDAETTKVLRRLASFLRHVAEAMKAAEWLYSGDYSEETFKARIVEISEKFAKLAGVVTDD